MNTTECIKWLWRYRDAKIAYKKAAGEYEEYRELIEGTGAMNYSDMPKAYGRKKDLSDGIVRLERLCKKKELSLKVMNSIRDDITAAIEKLPDENEKLVLSLRHIQLDGRSGIRKLTWQEIGIEMLYTDRQALNYYNKAVKHLCEIIS